MHVMRSRLSSERGVTLPEVLVTVLISLILSLATFALIDVTIRQTGEIDARVDSVQRGRVGMDLMTRQLRSQVCLGTAPARSVTAATATSISFYVHMGDPSTPGSSVSATATPTPRIAERRSLSLENGAIIERRWVGVPSTTEPTGYLFPTDPASTRELIKPVELVTDPAPALFRYYAYDTAAVTPEPKKLLVPGATGLSDADLRAVAKVQVKFRAMPWRTRPDRRASSVFLTDVAMRTVDPNADLIELNAPCL